MTVVDLGGGRYLVSEGLHQRCAYAVIDRGRTWVFVDGRVDVIETAPDRASARRGVHDDTGALMAPMPATVLRVNVAPGEIVSRGDVLLVLEAMKMELPVSAPRDGTVAAVSCRPGELVQPGVPLVDLTPPAGT